MDLTSRDGDWFLDELCSMSSNVLNTLEMLTVKPLLSHDLSLKIVTAMKSSDAVYTSLQELNVHFRTIIVPETIKCLESGEATVARNVAALQSLINALDQPLDTLITALEKQLLNAIMGLQVRVDPLTSCVSTECYLCSKTCVLFSAGRRWVVEAGAAHACGVRRIVARWERVEHTQSRTDALHGIQRPLHQVCIFM